MTRTTAERGVSKSNGARATVVRCSIYGRNRAGKKSAVSTPHPKADHAKKTRVWGLNGVENERHTVTRPSQADQDLVAEADESTDTSRVGPQSKRTTCCSRDPVICRHADINFLPVNRRDLPTCERWPKYHLSGDHEAPKSGPDERGKETKRRRKIRP